LHKFFVSTLFIASYVLLSPVYSKPPASPEELLLTTSKITCKTNKGKKHTGTGFIFDFKVNEVDNREKAYFTNEIEYQIVESPYLVTNKHVIFPNYPNDYSEYADTVSLTFNLSNNDRNSISQYSATFGDTQNPIYKSFTLHTLQDVDLCALPLIPAINQVESAQTLLSSNSNAPNFYTPNLYLPTSSQSLKVLYRSLNDKHLPDLSTEEAIQDVLMVGYPRGISDETNNLPLVRKGITASHIRENFMGKPEVLIDAACFPGSSGSPVFLTSSGNFFNPRLLGTLWGGPMHNVSGHLILDNGQAKRIPIPTEVAQTSTLIPMHLGYVIKAEKLTDIQNTLSKIFPTQ